MKRGHPITWPTAVIFFQTQEPIEPVMFVHRICTDAIESSGLKRSRWVQRLTPMTLMGKATEKGLDEVARAVLGPHFHAQSQSPRKVRPESASFHSQSGIPYLYTYGRRRRKLLGTFSLHSSKAGETEADPCCGSHIIVSIRFVPDDLLRQCKRKIGLYMIPFGDAVRT